MRYIEFNPYQYSHLKTVVTSLSLWDEARWADWVTKVYRSCGLTRCVVGAKEDRLGPMGSHVAPLLAFKETPPGSRNPVLEYWGNKDAIARMCVVTYLTGKRRTPAIEILNELGMDDLVEKLSSMKDRGPTKENVEYAFTKQPPMLPPSAEITVDRDLFGDPVVPVAHAELSLQQRLAARIGNLRASGMKQSDVAKAAGVGASTISKIQTGSESVSEKTMLAVENGLSSLSFECAQVELALPPAQSIIPEVCVAEPEKEEKTFDSGPQAEGDSCPPEKAIEEVIHFGGDHWFDAREIHSWLKGGGEFSTGENFWHWFQRRTEHAGMVEGKDWRKFSAENCSKLGRPEIRYEVTLDGGLRIGLMERGERGNKLREFAITCMKTTGQAVHDARTAQERLIEQMLSTQNLLTQIVAQNNQQLQLTQRDLGDMRVEVSQLKAATTPEALDEKIRENVVARAVKGMPTGYASAAKIRDTFFQGACDKVVGRCLVFLGHPRGEVEISDASGDLYETLCFILDGMEQSVDKIWDACKFERSTAQRYYFSCPYNRARNPDGTLGQEKEFVVTKDSLVFDARVRALWSPKLPPEEAEAVKHSAPVINIRES